MTDNWTPNRRKHQERKAASSRLQGNKRNHGRRLAKIDLTPIIDAGREYYKTDPEALLASVARKAHAQYASKEDQLAFLEGYQQARMQHEEYQNEQTQTDTP